MDIFGNMDWLAGIILTVTTGSVMSAVGYWILKVKIIVKKQVATEKGVQALLRDRIIQIFNDYSAKKYMPIYARENVESLFRDVL